MSTRQGCGGGGGGSGYSGYSGYSGGGYSGGGGHSGHKRDIASTNIASSLVKRVFGLTTRQQGCNQGAMCTSNADCVSGLCNNPSPQCQVYGTCDPCTGS